ncbi:hypothetical protein [Thiohalobacter sp.]|uniref:hypothetical protein n=1 Tax=Thiohalobacter sp. TaxID=2025948 RepID=UPI002603E119|nr:hypothetical protein [Thiohalobacter sp.]
MNASKLLPFMVAMSAPQESRDEIFQLVLPNMVRMNDNTRVALSAFSAQNVVQQFHREQAMLGATLLREFGEAKQMLSSTNKNALTENDLKKLPTIRRLNLKSLVEEVVK